MTAPSPQIRQDSIVSARRDQVSADLGGEVVVMAMDKGAYFGLDEIGGRIWALLQEARSVAAIRDLLVTEYDVDAATCERDLVAFLQRLAAEGLVEVRDSETS